MQDCRLQDAGADVWMTSTQHTQQEVPADIRLRITTTPRCIVNAQCRDDWRTTTEQSSCLLCAEFSFSVFGDANGFVELMRWRTHPRHLVHTLKPNHTLLLTLPQTSSGPTFSQAVVPVANWMINANHHHHPPVARSTTTTTHYVSHLYATCAHTHTRVVCVMIPLGCATWYDITNHKQTKKKRVHARVCVMDERARDPRPHHMLNPFSRDI